MYHSFYILDEDKNTVPADYDSWIEWMRQADRLVARTVIVTVWCGYPEEIIVSTAFLGVNHATPWDSDAQVFETLVMDKDDYSGVDMDRYSTWADAEAGHKRMVEKWLTISMGRIVEETK